MVYHYVKHEYSLANGELPKEPIDVLHESRTIRVKIDKGDANV